MTREISPAGLQITPDKNSRQQDNQASGISEKHQPFRPSTGQLTAIKNQRSAQTLAQKMPWAAGLS